MYESYCSKVLSEAGHWPDRFDRGRQMAGHETVHIAMDHDRADRLCHPRKSDFVDKRDQIVNRELYTRITWMCLAAIIGAALICALISPKMGLNVMVCGLIRVVGFWLVVLSSLSVSEDGHMVLVGLIVRFLLYGLVAGGLFMTKMYDVAGMLIGFTIPNIVILWEERR